MHSLSCWWIEIQNDLLTKSDKLSSGLNFQRYSRLSLQKQFYALIANAFLQVQSMSLAEITMSSSQEVNYSNFGFECGLCFSDSIAQSFITTVFNLSFSLWMKQTSFGFGSSLFIMLSNNQGLRMFNNDSFWNILSSSLNQSSILAVFKGVIVELQPPRKTVGVTFLVFASPSQLKLFFFTTISVIKLFQAVYSSYSLIFCFLLFFSFFENFTTGCSSLNAFPRLSSVRISSSCIYPSNLFGQPP